MRLPCPPVRMLAILLALLVPARAAWAEDAPLRPALWKVADADTTVWLFGTVHMLPPGHAWLDGPVAAALAGSAELATEVVDPAGTATQAALLRRAMLPRGQDLRRQLPPAVRSGLDRLLDRAGLPYAAVARYKPWYAAVVLSAVPLMRRGFSAANGVEGALGAARPGAVRSGLETPDAQLALLDGLPRPVQIAYLASVIADFDQIDPMVDAMAQAWGRGDAEDLARLIAQDQGKDDPLLVERLITRRNRAFAGWIARRLARPGTVFVALGAGHLAGPDSVQAVLAARGISVERVQ